MSLVAFVSCVKQKRRGRWAARDLYTSTLFRLSRGYAVRPGDETLWLAGRLYQRELAQRLAAWLQHDPLQGLAIGYRLRSLDRTLADRQSRVE